MEEKKWEHYGTGVEISDIVINDWVWQVLDSIRSGKCHTNIGSGDTTVIGLKYSNEIQVYIANRSGVSTLRFSTVKGYEDVINPQYYRRPKLVVSLEFAESNG